MSEDNFNMEAAQDMPGFYSIEDVELARLREIERLAGLLVGGDEYPRARGTGYCFWCDTWEMSDPKHTADCPWARLRAALGRERG